MLGDDALVYAQRLSQWCSRAPDLEEDIALANVALDLLGQARLLLARAAVADPSVVPRSGVPGRRRTRWPSSATRRAVPQRAAGRGVNGDFATQSSGCCCSPRTGWPLLERLAGSRDPVLAAVAAKGVKELTYHRDYAARWVVTLARGTGRVAPPAARRARRGSGRWCPSCSPPTRRSAGSPPPASASILHSGGRDRAVLQQVLDAAGVDRPPDASPAATPPAPRRPRTPAGTGSAHRARSGRCSPRCRSVARAHPEGSW